MKWLDSNESIKQQGTRVCEKFLWFPKHDIYSGTWYWLTRVKITQKATQKAIDGMMGWHWRFEHIEEIPGKFPSFTK